MLYVKMLNKAISEFKCSFYSIITHNLVSSRSQAIEQISIKFLFNEIGRKEYSEYCIIWAYFDEE